MAVPSQQQPVAGLIFDLEDVLYDATVWRRWLLQLLSRIGLHAEYHDFFRLWERDFLHDVYLGRCEYWESFRRLLDFVGLSAGRIEEIVAASYVRQRDWEQTIRPLPGVPATLAQLTADGGTMLAVLTNSDQNEAALLARLERLKISRHFTEVFCSRNLKCVLTDPSSFETTLSALKLSPDETVFVGHDEGELQGASKAGMRTVAFNFDIGAKADVYIDRFEQLLQVVDRRSSRQLAG